MKTTKKFFHLCSAYLKWYLFQTFQIMLDFNELTDAQIR